MSPPSRRLCPPEHYLLAGTLAPLRFGRGDPTARLSGDELWWATRTPDGPGTLHLLRAGGDLLATGYGQGAGWLIERSEAIAGLCDDVSGFDELAGRHPVVRQAWHEHPGLRLVRTGRLFHHLVPTILAQRVTSTEAMRGYRGVLYHFGEPAPGPVPGLLLPPEAAAIAGTPYWTLHRFGVERKRADALCRVAARAAWLDAAPDPATATARLTSIFGIGAWTASVAVRVAHGDPDQVTTGDYNIPHHIVHALTGAIRAGSREPEPPRKGNPGGLSPADARMLELLEPFRPQRGRACQLLLASAPRAPRRGPRLSPRSFASF